MLQLTNSRYTNKVTPENIPKKKNEKLSSVIVLTNQKPSITLCPKDQQKFKLVLLLIEV